MSQTKNNKEQMGPGRQTDMNHSRVPFLSEYYSIIDNKYDIMN